MTTWLTLAEAAQYARTGKRCLYGAVRDGRLKAARINQRGDLRFTPEWLDAWLVEAVQSQGPVEPSLGERAHDWLERQLLTGGSDGKT